MLTWQATASPEEDEEGTHRALSVYLDAMTDSIERHNGKAMHFSGDAVLADFTTVSEPLTCAAALRVLRGKHAHGN